MKLYSNGISAFAEIVNQIEKVQESIFIRMFIWRDDTIGNQLLQRLLEAANRGVKVYIEKDKLGSSFEWAEEKKQSIFHKRISLGLFLRAFCVDVVYPMKGKAFLPIQKKNGLVEKVKQNPNITLNTNKILSNHSKIYIFDEKTLIMGGMNIEDKSHKFDVSGRLCDDFMIKLEGENYVSKYKECLQNTIVKKDFADVDFIMNTIQNGKKNFFCKESLTALIKKTQKKIDVLVSYLGNKDMMDLIINLANKGIEVNILIPIKANIQNDFNYRNVKYIYERTEGRVSLFLLPCMLHLKLLRIDDLIITFGSTNLNNLAMNELLETNIVLQNMEDELKKDFDKSIKALLDKSKLVKNVSELKYNKLLAFFESIV